MVNCYYKNVVAVFYCYEIWKKVKYIIFTYKVNMVCHVINYVYENVKLIDMKATYKFFCIVNGV